MSMLLLASSLLVAAYASCLCVFDIDRTLTGEQSNTKACPSNNIISNVPDCAYSGGTLTLSELGQGYAKTFCAGCLVGVVSAGSACGNNSPERAVLVKHLNETGMLLSQDWSPAGQVTSPLVTNWPDGQKQKAVGAIVDWYGHIGHSIAAADVHFFDDRASNVSPFSSTKYNARQISCATRDPADPSRGLFGATLSGLISRPGVHLC